FNFIKHATRLDRGDPELDAALARAHADFDRLLGDRLVGEHADPQLAATLDETGDATTGGFDLTCGKRAMGRCLQAVLAKADEVGALRQTVVTALELLAVFGSLGLQHGNSPYFADRSRRPSPASRRESLRRPSPPSRRGCDGSSFDSWLAAARSKTSPL